MEVCGQLHIPDVLSLAQASLEPIGRRVGRHQCQFRQRENYLFPYRCGTMVA